jgi:2-dehydropantoate 2-reductase
VSSRSSATGSRPDAEVRFIVYGAGAIGGVVGARLAQGGHDVALIARGAHFEAIRDHGLRIQSPIDDATLAIPVVNHPSQLTFSADDVVMLAMKSQDTIAACEALGACATPDISVACFQNGVENERVVLRHFADTYAVCVMSPTSHIEPGVVIAQSAPVSGLLDIGRYPSGLDDRAHAIAAALNASTFHSIPRPDVMRWKYTKLLMNLANSIEATVTPDPKVKDLAAIVRTEGEACLRAAGIDFASRAEDKERRADRMHVQPVNGEYRGGGSSWQSLARGTRSIETDYLNGEIVTLGRLHGIATPANALMQCVANEQARIGAPPKSVPIETLLAQL